MSRFLSERFEKLCAYVPGEQPKDMEYIKLNTNESPYPPSPEVLRAVDENLLSGLRLYSDPECRRLREAIAKENGVSLENVFLGNGSDEVLSFIFMAYCDNKTGVSYPDISYGFYSVYSDLYGLSKNEVPLREDFSIDPRDYMNLGSTVVIANPNAPTGLCLSLEDIEKIAKSNPHNLVAIDEAYVDFGGDSGIELTKSCDNLLVVRTFSKSRSLAGARLGFAIGNPELIADLEKLRYSTNPFNVNSLSLAVGLAALEGKDYYDRIIYDIIQARECAAQKMREMGFDLTESRGNFLFAKHANLSGIELYLGLKSRGILVRHFKKPRIDDYIRITVGTPRQMDVMLCALKEMLTI